MPSPGRPVLLVDIDGVLNVYGVDECPDGYLEVELFPGDDEPARLRVEHGGWLRELGEHFDLVWASAWGADAHRLPPRSRRSSPSSVSGPLRTS